MRASDARHKLQTIPVSNEGKSNEMQTKKQIAARKRAEKEVARVARIKAYARNIRKTYAQATQDEISNGLTWYAEAFRFIVQIAQAFTVEPITACAVTAALSPNNSWAGNKLDLQLVLSHFASGKLAQLVKKYGAKEGTYKPLGDKKAFKGLGIRTYPVNVVKAFRILKSGDVSLLKSQKVSAFFDNIYYPESEAVTVDTHAFSIASGKVYTTKNCPSLTGSRYNEVAEAYAIVASELHLKPYQLQAITWIAYRRVRGLGAHLD